MDATLIQKTFRGTLDGAISFPDAVQAFLEAGVESYHVDYVTRRTTFHGADGDVSLVAIDYENLPPIAAEFDLEELRAAILDSQRHGQKFRDFTRRAMVAGVMGYFAFLRGQRVTYWGRQGDQHTEWFPGAGPGGDS